MRPPPNPGDQNPFLDWTITADDVDQRIARAVRICLARHLQETYSELLNEPIPPKLAQLLQRLERQGPDFAEKGLARDSFALK